jgi:hypothetical protein
MGVLTSVSPASAAGAGVITGITGTFTTDASTAAVAKGIVGGQVKFSFDVKDAADYVIATDGKSTINQATAAAGDDAVVSSLGTNYANGAAVDGASNTDVITVKLSAAAVGTSVVTIAKIAAQRTQVAKLTVTWIAAGSTDLASVVVKAIADADAGDCTVAAYEALNAVAYDVIAGSAATLCVIALDGTGAAKTGVNISVLAESNATLGGVASAVASSTADANGLFTTAIDANGVPGTGKFSVTVTSTNLDGTSNTKTGSTTIKFADSVAKTAVITQSVVALDDDVAKTTVATFSVSDKNGTAIAKADDNAASLIIDSDVSTTATIDAAGEEDATATVVIEAASSVSAAGTETKGTISVTCTAGVYEMITIQMSLVTDTVQSNKITVYCTENIDDSSTETMTVTNVGNKISAKVLAGIATKPTYPVADAAAGSAVTFSASAGSFSTSTPAIVGGVATADLYSSGVTSKVTVVGAMGGATASLDVAVSGGLETLINSLIKKLNALAILVAKIQKKLGVK